jgi:hypothetical protein
MAEKNEKKKETEGQPDGHAAGPFHHFVSPNWVSKKSREPSWRVG